MQTVFFPETTSAPALHSWTRSRDAQGSREYARGEKYIVVSKQASWPQDDHRAVKNNSNS